MSFKDIEEDAFASMWDMGKPKKVFPKVPSASKGSMYVQDVKPVQYRPRVKYSTKQLTPRQKYIMMQRNQRARTKVNKGLFSAAKVVGQAGSGFFKAAGSKIKQTEAYQKYDVKRSKDKIWNQYKKDKQAESRKAELDAYKKKLYGK